MFVLRIYGENKICLNYIVRFSHNGACGYRSLLMYKYNSVQAREYLRRSVYFTKQLVPLPYVMFT